MVVVGERLHDLGGLSDSGAAFVFRRRIGTWAAASMLAASDPESDAQFGSGVALAGGTAVVGAYVYDHGGFTDAGSADVFLVSNIFIFDDGFEDDTTDSWDSTSP